MQAWRDAGADPEEMPRATYKLVSVFAQDQVAPLPPPARPVPLTAPIAEMRRRHRLLRLPGGHARW
jgi:hypothetical protein